MDADRQSGRRALAQSNGPRKRPSRTLRQQQQAAKAEESVDDSAWIHRDKLAQIEIQEMEQAGMHVRQPHRSDSVGQMRPSSRAASRTGLHKSASKDQIAGSAVDDEQNQQLDYERKRVSTIHAAEEEDDYDGVELHPGFDAELRTPEEVAAEHHGYRQHTLRPSTSRIPISKAGPAGASNGTGDRDSLRSRSGSNAFPSTWDDIQYAKRLRSNSAGSGVLLDDPEYTQRPPSSTLRNVSEPVTTTQSPARAKPTAKTTPNRKPLNDVANNRGASSARPPSSGHAARPSTSQGRPEGEAPWIATMYKPDPRLPPEEQMLPTHAKRMMQEQWEKEGKIGSAYDRELRLINDDEIKKPETATKNTTEPLQQQRQQQSHAAAIISTPDDMARDKENVAPHQSDAWPIAPAINTDVRVESPRPSTSGGYRTTPTIRVSSPTTFPAVLPSKPVVEQQASSQSLQQTVPRMQDYDEKHDGKTRKGCCCVMM